MVIDERQIVLIEVTLNDKLSYRQLRTIDTLVREKTDLFLSIPVERVTLQKAQPNGGLGAVAVTKV